MNKKFRNILIAIVAIVAIGSCFFMFKISPISKNDKIAESNTEIPSANFLTEELTKGLVVEQEFTCSVDNIKNVAVVFSRLYYLDENDANNTLAIELLEGNSVLASTSIKSNEIPDQHRVYLTPSTSLSEMKGKILTLKIYENSKCDTGVALMANSDAKTNYRFGNSTMNGTICFSVSDN